MKRLAVWFVPLAVVLASCAPPRNPDEQAQILFNKGQKYLLQAIEQEEAAPAQMDQARAALSRHEKGVTQSLAALLRKHKELFGGVMGGKKTADLLAIEQAFHQAHEQAMKSVGAMHEDLEKAVGEKVWKGASARMGAKAEKFLKE